MQFAAPAHLEYVRRIRLLDAQCYIRLRFLEKSIANMAAGDELSFLSGERARVDAERH